MKALHIIKHSSPNSKGTGQNFFLFKTTDIHTKVPFTNMLGHPHSISYILFCSNNIDKDAFTVLALENKQHISSLKQTLKGLLYNKNVLLALGKKC